jgi:hypothetical protein
LYGVATDVRRDAELTARQLTRIWCKWSSPE